MNEFDTIFLFTILLIMPLTTIYVTYRLIVRGGTGLNIRFLKKFPKFITTKKIGWQYSEDFKNE